MTTLGPTYFEDKEPSEETAREARKAKDNGFRIIYPENFLRKLDPNRIKPQEPSKIEEKDKKIKPQ